MYIKYEDGEEEKVSLALPSRNHSAQSDLLPDRALRCAPVALRDNFSTGAVRLTSAHKEASQCDRS